MKGIGIYDLIGWGLSETEMFKKIKANGFEYIGIYWFNQSDEEITKTIENARNCGLIIEVVHGPLQDNMLIWKEDEQGETYFEKIKNQLLRVAELGAKNYVLHPCGKDVTSFNETGLKRFKKLVKIAEKNNIILNIENLRTVDHTIFLFEKIKSDNFKFCLDTGHANVWCYKPLDAIKKFGKVLNTVHINDNDGGYCHDHHLIPYDGNIEWERVVPALNKVYDGPLMLELNNFKNLKMAYPNIDVYLKTAYDRAKKLLELE